MNSETPPDPFVSTEIGSGRSEEGRRTSPDRFDDDSFERERLEARIFGDDPKKIGRFPIVRRLGGGGQGKVYEAYDEKLDRKAAIKVVVQRSRVEDRAYERMCQEAQALAKLDHPHVVRIHEANEYEGELFLVMEYLGGSNLADWLQHHERSVDEILYVFLQAAEGLHAAHQAGLIHRDVKPANVMVDPDPDRAHGVRVRVVDFGLVKPTSGATPDDGAPDSTRQSAFGTLTLPGPGPGPGTPGYRSPEQLHGRTELTPATDQFSFAVSLYQALHGTRPFQENTEQNIRETIARGTWQTTPTRSVPRWLDALVKRALQPDPRDRFADMEAMVKAIRRRWKIGEQLMRGARWPLVGVLTGFLFALVIPPSPASPWELCLETRKARQVQLVSSIPAESKLEESLKSYASALAKAEESACDLPAEHAEKSPRRQCLARLRDEYVAYTTALRTTTEPPATIAEYISTTSGHDGVAALRAPSVCAAPGAELSAPVAGEMTQAALDTYRGLIQLKAATNTGVFRLDEADALVDSARESGSPGLLAEAFYERGRLKYFYRYGQEAYEDFSEAVRHAQQANLTTLEVDSHIFTAMAAFVAGRPLEAIDIRLADAQAHLAAMPEPRRAERSASIALIEGRIAVQRGDLEEAMERFERAKASYRPGAVAAELVNLNLAGVHRQRGELAEAATLLEPLLAPEMLEQLPTTARGNIRLTHARSLRASMAGFELAERPAIAERAAATLEAARGDFRQGFGAGSLWEARVDFELARVDIELEAYIKADSRLRRVRATLTSLDPTRLPKIDVARALMWLAFTQVVLAPEDDDAAVTVVEEALELLADAAELLRSLPNDGHGELMYVYEYRGALLTHLERTADAIFAYDQAIALLSQTPSYSAPKMASLRRARDELIPGIGL